MIGTIRKHSKWLWIVIASLTIISFVVFFSPSQRMNGGGGGPGNLGSINGKKITPDAFLNARNETYLYFFFKTHEWPDKNPQISADDLQREIYLRLMLIQKADDLGIYITDNEAAQNATRYLLSLGRKDETMPLDDFVKQVLQPKGLTAEDFENFARYDLAIQELVKRVTLPGELITPREAAIDYQREHQELSAQIVLFSASNYLSQITATPEAVQQFYTNYLADYRLPDRVQVSYVAFTISNYFGQAQAELKTNLDEIVESNFRQLGVDGIPGAKTPDEAKAKIRKAIIEQDALGKAEKDATEFANSFFDQDPPKPEYLATAAKQEGLKVHVTEPFSINLGSEQIGPLEAFNKAAFDLTPDEPFAGPINGPDAVYVIALDKKLPSEIQPLQQIRNQVTSDFQFYQAVSLAREVGTNFAHTLPAEMATGRSFASVAVATGLRPEILPPFSISTQELPGFEKRADITQIKQAAFTTPLGKPGDFIATDDGGFIIYVQSLLPMDKTAMDADLPQFAADLRDRRQREMFDNWIQHEANAEMRDMPFDRQAAANQP